MTQSLSPIKVNELQNAGSFSSTAKILALTDSDTNTVQLLNKTHIVSGLVSSTSDNALTSDTNGLFVPDLQSAITTIQGNISTLEKLQTIIDIVTVTNGAINLVAQKALYTSTPSGNTTYTFTLPNNTVGVNQAFTFELYIDMSSSVYSLTFPLSVTWQDNITPDMDVTGHYFFAFRTLDGGTTWKGNLQGIW